MPMFDKCDLADWELSWEVELTLFAFPTLRFGICEACERESITLHQGGPGPEWHCQECQHELQFGKTFIC